MTKCKTAISNVKGREGKLFFRGYPIEELIDLSFEQVIYLVLHGELPSREQLRALDIDLLEVMGAENNRLCIDQSQTQNAATGKLIIRPVLKILQDQVLKSEWDATIHDSYKNNQDIALGLIALFPLVVARYSRLTRGLSITQPHRYYGYAKNLLYMIRGLEDMPSEKQARVFEKVLIMHVEHSYNASAHTARIAASTGADICACVLAALSSLSGPLHGGACKKVLEMTKPLGNKNREEIRQWVIDEIASGRKIWGLGHRVYKVLDPRARIIREIIADCLLEHQDEITLNTLESIEFFGIKEKGIYPNVDFYSGMLYRALGVPENILVGLFAVARLSGWLAHIFEQYETGTLLRPPEDEVEYTGPYPDGRSVPERHKLP